MADITHKGFPHSMWVGQTQTYRAAQEKVIKLPL